MRQSNNNLPPEDRGKMTRKRYVKLVAGTRGLQVQEMRDAMRYAIARVQRAQEQSNRQNHRRRGMGQ